jgi:hypothetical protein
MASSGQVRYQLKTPYRDGTTHIVMEPLDLMARLAAHGRAMKNLLLPHCITQMFTVSCCGIFAGPSSAQ